MQFRRPAGDMDGACGPAPEFGKGHVVQKEAVRIEDGSRQDDRAVFRYGPQDIRGGQQARDIDGMPEKVVDDGYQHMVRTIPFVEGFQVRAQLPVGRNADGHGVIPDGRHDAVRTAALRLVPLFRKVARQADAVLQLGEPVVPVCRRQRPSGEDVEFVPQVNEGASQPAAAGPAGFPCCA